jgi:hypothetical protein
LPVSLDLLYKLDQTGKVAIDNKSSETGRILIYNTSTGTGRVPIYNKSTETGGVLYIGTPPVSVDLL